MNYQKEFDSVLNKIVNHKDKREVFSDWLTMASAALYHYKKDKVVEGQYLDLAKKYSKEDLDKFAYLLSITTLSLQQETKDLLGRIFTFNNFGNKYLGQYFTPDNICNMMGVMVLPDKLDRIYTVYDPFCGAGGMLIGTAKAMEDKKFDYKRNVIFYGNDISDSCAKMTFIQLSILQAPAVITCGDIFSDKKVWKRETVWCYTQDVFSRLNQQMIKEGKINKSKNNYLFEF